MARVRGVSLVEVLVSICVLMCVAVGNFGLVVAVSRRAAQAEHHLAASGLAGELVHRMRLNRAAAAAGAYRAGGNVGNGTTSGSNAGAPGTAMPASARAEQDMRIWQADVASRLPSGEGEVVTQTAAGVVVVTVTLQWQQAAVGLGRAQVREVFAFRL
jgi:type IV pilus assembly protein PilV